MNCLTSQHFVNQQQNANVIAAYFGISSINEPLEFEFGGFVTPTQRKATISNDFFGYFCVRSATVPLDPFTNIMERFDNKVVSFWFGDMPSYDEHDSSEHKTVGELGIGTLNEGRISAGPQIRFWLESVLFHPQNTPPAWITLNPVQIRIKNGAIPRNSCKLVFLYESPHLIVPPDVYEIIVGNLKKLNHKALQESLPFLPAEVNRDIHAFAATRQVTKFSCADAEAIPDLKFGNLHITNSMLYRQVGNECQLQVEPKDSLQQGQCQFTVGNYILRHFHVVVNFNTAGLEFIELSAKS